MKIVDSLLAISLLIGCNESNIDNYQIPLPADRINAEPNLSRNIDTIPLIIEEKQIVVRNYAELIKNAEKRYKSLPLDTGSVADLLPLNEDEYILLYETSTIEAGAGFFDHLYNCFQSFSSNESVFKGFLNLAEFEDGEFAESYFEDIYSIILKYEVAYCKLRNSLSNEAKRRIGDVAVTSED